LRTARPHAGLRASGKTPLMAAESVIQTPEIVELLPETPGGFEFTLQMGTLRGKLVLE
jgi:hypothetical protein